ncbi:MAG: homoserine dehydrogenase [Gaiellaceae bacterium]
MGAAVNRLLTDSADDIERATGHRLRVVKALVRDLGKERENPPAGGVLTTDFQEIVDDPSIAVVAEVMGGVDPTGDHVLELLRRGKHVVTANKQLVARRGAELFAAASEAGVQLRFEASVCAAIPVIKVLRESLVVTNVHSVLGIVNGTTNFVLTEMEAGKSYDDALAEAQRRGYAEADPSDDVNGADAAAKMAILATVAFNSRVDLEDVDYSGITTIDPLDVAAARELDMVIRLVGSARLVDGHFDVRVQAALVDKQHPLAKVDGAFNAVMLQGDAIREITLEGPGAGGTETASAVIADITSVIGTMHTGFLQNDAAWRELPKLPAGDSRSPFYFRLLVEDRPGALARVAEGLAQRDISIARLLQHQNGNGAALHVVTHEARAGALDEALAALGALPEVHKRSHPLPVVSDRGVAELGWA